MAQAPYSTEQTPGTDINATPVRQGMTGTGLIWVLIVSFLLVLAVLFGAWAYRARDLANVDHNNRAQPAEAQQYQTR